MRKLIVPLSLISVIILSCNKQDTNTEIVETQNELVMDPTVVEDTIAGNGSYNEEIGNGKDAHTYNYKAEDGTMAIVTFLNSDTEHTLTVKMNDKTYVLDQKEAWAKGAAYEKDEVKAHNQRDDLDFTVDGKTIKLKRQYDTN